MTWAYNQIDVYLSSSENILGETSVATNSWVPLSTYGLLRGRPAITASTVEGDSISIPGRNGKQLSVITNRSNAKLKFEILMVDAWPFADLKQQNIMIRDRYNIVKSFVMDAKRVAFKAPGHVANSYYEIVNVTMTPNDADEKALSLTVEFEIIPYEYYFEGNMPVSVAAYATETFVNEIPFDECCPTYSISVLGGGIIGDIEIVIGGDKQGTITIQRAIQLINKTIILDTDKELAYYINGNNYVNVNRYINGDYKLGRIPKNSTINITNGNNVEMLIYTRKGIKV